MSTVKISSKVDESTWEALREYAHESDRHISGVLSEAIAEYLRRRRVRPVVLERLEESIRDNQELGRLLAK